MTGEATRGRERTLGPATRRRVWRVAGDGTPRRRRGKAEDFGPGGRPGVRRRRLVRQGVGWRWEWATPPTSTCPGVLRRRLGGADQPRREVPRGVTVLLRSAQERSLEASPRGEGRRRGFAQRLVRLRPENPYGGQGMRRANKPRRRRKRAKAKGRG